MKLAIWLLERFEVPMRNESLMGDLIEEHAVGRSALWLWGQTVVAIADMATRDLRDHWVLGLRAICTGWISSFLFACIWMPLYWYGWGWTWKIYLIRPLGPTVVSLFFAVDKIVNVLIWPLALGWVVARTHRAERAAAILAFAASVAVCARWVCVQCVPPDDVDPTFMYGLSGVLGVLFGGLLPKPRRRTA